MSQTAIVLLSGGLDSATVLAIAKSEGFRPTAVSFSYGQRHTQELDRAAKLAEAARVEHLVLNIDLGGLGGSALTDSAIAVPKTDSVENIGSEIPVTYVPARNTIFLSYALAVAEVRGAADIFIGVNALDYSGYPDCRPEYIAAFEAMANLATKSAVTHDRPRKIHTPLIAMTKAEIIARGISLGVNYANTISCYDPSDAGRSCGSCDACLLRLKGFAENNISDPIAYQQSC